ncbi:hypothetical protein D3C87_1920110 [compost metagenome]
MALVALIEHVREVAGNHEEHLHAESMDEVVQHRQREGGAGAVHRPGMAGINQRKMKRDAEQHQISPDRIEEKLALVAAFSHRLPLVILSSGH